MPPKAKFTREEIIAAALELARERGIEAVVARELGKKLGTSSTPIFTAFANMEEVWQEVRKAAMKEYEAFVHDAVNYTPSFKQFGVQMVQFAVQQPKLFQLLYMQEHDESQSVEAMIEDLGEVAWICLETIQKDYGLEPLEARALFRQVWLYTFSICVLAASRVCHFSEQEVSEMLSQAFAGTLMLIKSGRWSQCHVQPEKKEEEK